MSSSLLVQDGRVTYLIGRKGTGDMETVLQTTVNIHTLGPCHPTCFVEVVVVFEVSLVQRVLFRRDTYRKSTDGPFTDVSC